MKTVLAAALILAATPAAFAQTLPKSSGDPLQDICTSFLEQSGQGISGNRNKLCTCLVRETQARLTTKEMEIYSKMGETGEQPPPALMEKIIGVATACLTEAQ